MLALTRKKGESLVVNNNIEITVLEIRGRSGENRHICTERSADIPQGSISSDSE